MTTSWMDRGACRTADPELFYPDGEGTAHADEIELAKAICRPCPVFLRCYAYGLSEEYGIWGATTEKERRSLRRKLPKHSPRVADRPPKECSMCGEKKEITEFNRKSQRHDGYDSRCRPCTHLARQEAELAQESA